MAKATNTKKAQATKIFRTMMRRKNAPKPAEVKARFQEKVGLSKAAAATYYHNIASGAWD